MAETTYLIINLSNFLTCFWIFLGTFDYSHKPDFEPPNSWIVSDENEIGSLQENPSGIYVIACYYIWTALTSVGFGTYSQLRNREMWMTCLVEIIQIAVGASFIFVITNLVNNLDNSYDSKMRESLNKAYNWVL